jgi:signal transduction histidine kinase
MGLHTDHFETIRVRKDGRRIDVSLSVSPIKDSTGKVVGAAAISRDVTQQKLLEREVIEVAAREQQRIGQDLHDGTGQELTGLAMMAERLAGQLEERKDPEAGAATWIVDGLVQALRHVRDLSKGLVPVELDAAGLMAALAGLAKRTNELHCVTCTFRCDEPVCILDNQTATHLYRLSQEAVTNALKHGQARNIVISLTHDGNRVSLEITDDGMGITDTSRQTSGTGLQIMHYRAELIRAKLTIGPAHPRGTQVVVTLPRQQDGWAAMADPQTGVLRRKPEPAEAKTSAVS